MTVYIILIFVILLFGSLQSGKRNGDKETLCMFLVLFFVLAFRKAEAVGIDSIAGYYLSFINIENFEIEFMSTNSGFYFLMRLISRLTGHNYQLYIVTISAFMMYSYYRLVKKYSLKPMISVLWFLGMLFYTFSFSGFKQAIAMAILTYAFDCIMEDRTVLFAGLVLLAGSMHFPAFVFFLAYPVSRFKNSRNYLILLAALLLTVYLFRGKILSIMQIMYYGTEGQGVADGRFLGTKALIMLVIAVVAVTIKHDAFNRLYTTLLYYLGFAIVFQTFCIYNNTFERLADYFFQFSILLMPLILSQNEYFETTGNGSFKKIGTIVTILFCVWRFLSYVGLPYAGLTPYYFFWQ